MKRQHLLVLSTAVVILVALGLGYANRAALRVRWQNISTPALPASTHKLPDVSAGSATPTNTDNSPFEGGVATSTHFVMISSPQKTTKPNVDPLAIKGALPDQMNLDVPFTSQAPLGDWSYPYQEACEEASTYMVDQYYKGASGVIDPQIAKKAIDGIVLYENQTLGYYKDTPASDVIKIIKGYFGYADVRILPLTGPDDIKRAIANGYPVIVPANGKTLPNPNFKDGGPLYHMLVVRGYTQDHFITNDPGTRNGKNFTYTYRGLLDSVHDWDAAANKADGPAVMLVIIPNS